LYNCSVYGKPIEALIDTGSDITIAGVNVAKKHRWKIRPTEQKSVKVANGEYILIDGITTEHFSVGKSMFSLTSTSSQT